MPRPGPRRPSVTLRIGQTALDRLDRAAAEQGIQRSELIRRMLAYAEWKMPKDWRP